MRRKYGFTLIEVLLVVIIVGLLVTTAGVISSTLTRRNKITAAEAELRLILSASSAFRTDNDSWPAAGVINIMHQLVTRRYIIDPSTNDRDWEARVTSTPQGPFGAEERGRQGSVVNGMVVSIDENGTVVRP